MSTRTRKQPDFYGQESSNVCEIPQSPVSYQEATTGPDKRKWETAMETEMTLLKENHVWDLVKLPAGKRTVGSKWVFKVKTGLCRDTRLGWLHKVLPNSMEQTLMRHSAQLITTTPNGPVSKAWLISSSSRCDHCIPKRNT